MSYSPPPPHAKWEMPADPDLVAAIKTLAADDDDAEARLNDAERSHIAVEDLQRALLRQLDDTRCAGRSDPEDFASIIAGMDAALIDYAHRAIYDDPVWTQLHAVRQALIERL